jgi:hypothetical protein
VCVFRAAPPKSFAYNLKSEETSGVAMGSGLKGDSLPEDDTNTACLEITEHIVQCTLDPSSLKNEFNLHYILRISSYRAVNTLRLCYKNQSVNVV